MIMKKNILFASCLTVAFIFSTASAALIFSDNFDSATSGLNDNLGTRQSGTIAPLNYSFGGEGDGTGDINNNSLRLSGRSSGGDGDNNARINYDFAQDANLLTGGAFRVSFDMLQASVSYAAFSIGSLSSAYLATSARPAIAGNTDIGLLMSRSGSVERWDNGSNIFNNSSAVTSYSGSVFVPVEIVVTTANFSSGTSYSFSLSINGETVNLGSAANGTWDADGTNYMILSSRSKDTTSASRFDNFTVTAIPEPGMLTLVGLSLLALTGLYRRR